MKLILALALISTAPASAAQNETQPTTVYWRLMQRTGCDPLGGLVDEPRECVRIFARGSDYDSFWTRAECQDVIDRQLIPAGGIPYGDMFCKTETRLS